jgi:glucosamine--fructose-6-phosphate aminotransferase (isomerizing)
VNPEAPTRFESEAREQGSVLAARTDAGWEHAELAAELLRAAEVNYVVIAARGTSDNAARYAQYLLGTDLRLVVALAAPWLYEDCSPPRLEHGAVLAISQSGHSPDIAAVVAAAREQSRPAIAITNHPSSPVGDLADVVMPLLAGEERSVAATKTYMAELHAVAQLATSLSRNTDRASWFTRLPELVSSFADEQFAGRARFDPLADATLMTAVGRGLQFPTAHETALKVRELSGIPAEAFSLPDLIHGPVAALNRTGALWLVSTAGREQPDASTLCALSAEVGLTVAVSDRADVISAADIGIRVPGGLPEWLAPMLAVVPGQAAALRLGELRGVAVDQPPGLTKVTLTR